MEQERKYSYIDITREYKNREKLEKIHAFYWEKDSEGNFERKKDVFNYKDYYFYVEAEEAKEKRHPTIKYGKEIFSTVDGHKCIKATPIKKLSKDEYKYILSTYSKTYENDVAPLTRWIANNKPEYDKNVRKLYIDIETLRISGSYSPPGEAKAKISMITAYDNFTNKYDVFVFKKPDRELNIKEKYELHIAASEYQMMNQFIEYCKPLNPDYILGWNLESYDIPYIINRLENLNIDKNKLSSLNSCWVSPQTEVSAHKFSSFWVNIKGSGVFDLMAASQRLWLGKYCGYSLKKMTEEYLVKTGKIKVGKHDIGDADTAYHKKFEEMIEYNIQDVRLCVLLDEELKLFSNFQSFQEIISINVEESLIQSKNIVQYFLQNTDTILLNSNKGITVGSFPGGFVKDTIPGIYRKAAKYDFVSMYPSFILTYNISPDTILDEKQPGCISMNDKYFFKQKEGIVTKVIKELYKKRIGYKEAKNAELSLAYKLMMNSVYGQFAAPYSRIFSFSCAEAITHQGRRVILDLIDLVEQNVGGKIIMGDTDSICHYLEGFDDYDKILKLTEEMFEIMYKKDNVLTNKYIKLELEKIIDKMIIFGSEKAGIKKKYVEVMKYKDDNGKIVEKRKITGLDLIKSDTIQCAKDLQNELVDYFVENDNHDISDVNDIVNKYYSIFLKKIKEKDYLYFSIPAKLNKKKELYDGVDKNGRPKAKLFSIKSLENSGLDVGVNERFHIVVGNSPHLLVYNGVIDTSKDSRDPQPFGFSNVEDVWEDFTVDKKRMWGRIKSKTDIFYYFVNPKQQSLAKFLKG